MNKNQPKKKIAVIYARFSDWAQSKGSIDDQVRECQEFAARFGYIIIGCYTDYAKTGRNANRPGFQRMIADAAKRTFNTILVYKFDRFSREMRDHLNYDHELGLSGVKVESICEPYRKA